MSYYEPTDKMLNAFRAGFTNRSLAETSTEFASYLHTRELNSENVAKVLEILLAIEDISEMQLYANLMQSNNYVVYDGARNEYLINLDSSGIANRAEDVLNPGMDEVVLVSRQSALASPLPAERILCLTPHRFEELPCEPETNHRHVGKITMVKHKKVWFTLCKEDIKKEIEIEIEEKEAEKHIHLKDILNKCVIGKKFDIIFRSTRIPFILKYNALSELAKCSATRGYLFPQSKSQSLNPQKLLDDQLQTHSLFNESIAKNPEQLLAVRQIIAGPDSRAPYIVFGPPGK